MGDITSLSKAIQFTTFQEASEDDYLVVRLDMPAREEYYRLHIPSNHRLNQIDMMVAEPAIPHTKLGPGGIKAPNPDDVTYRRKRDEAYRHRWRLHLAEALHEGGKIELAGSTLEERADALASWNSGRLNALVSALQTACYGIKSVFDSAEDSFRRYDFVQASDDGDMSEDGLASE